MIGVKPIRDTSLTARVSINSAPALAAAMRETHRSAPLPPFRRLVQHDELVPMYQVDGDDRAQEAEAAARVLTEIAERLYRLREAYAEWSTFDAGAYFDLTTAQSQRLIKIVERVSTVHVIFYADLLLPSFQNAEQIWSQTFYPAYHRLQNQIWQDGLAQRSQGVDEQQPADNGKWGKADLANSLPGEDDFISLLRGYEQRQEMLATEWQHMVDVMRRARAALNDDIGFWTTSGAEDERARWRASWRRRPAPGLDPRLRPNLLEIPSLTLSIDFPLPIDRQPGRLRRLRVHRDRRRRWKDFRTR